MSRRETPDKLTCAYCGKAKEEIIFCIGASTKPEWCMIYGTGKMSCPDCYEKASQEGKQAVDKHIKQYNGEVST